MHVLLGSELVLLERSHELGGQAEGPEAEAALGAAADIVDQGDCALVQLALVVKLVLDHVHVDEVAHVGAGVPSNAVGISVDFAQHADHLCRVSGVCLGARGGGGRVGSGVLKVRLSGDFDDGEWESVGDLERAIDIHTDDGTGGGGREGLGAVLDDFHDHLEHPTSVFLAGEDWGRFSSGRPYQGLDLHGREGSWSSASRLASCRHGSKKIITYSAIVKDCNSWAVVKVETVDLEGLCERDHLFPIWFSL